ncbi:MAG: pentapeptide repeat-containing protein [Thiofilum sp.]|uniref:pentapeptide repeat-containing protein n=1 Tax=Thiofilum sp. TaxID=2212733 RepID=UPI0025D139C8|nr:pentapeptide repeat-containing protein [Thiofilum sp.]
MPDLLETFLSGLLLMPTPSAPVEKPVTLATQPKAPVYRAETNVMQRNFEGANLSLANFSGSNATGSNFRYAKLDYANLSLAQLKDADLTGASLNYALIHLTDLRGVRGLTKEQLVQACLMSTQDQDGLRAIEGFSWRHYHLPEGCQIWEQTLNLS